VAVAALVLGVARVVQAVAVEMLLTAQRSAGNVRHWVVEIVHPAVGIVRHWVVENVPHSAEIAPHRRNGRPPLGRMMMIGNPAHPPPATIAVPRGR